MKTSPPANWPLHDKSCQFKDLKICNTILLTRRPTRLRHSIPRTVSGALQKKLERYSRTGCLRAIPCQNALHLPLVLQEGLKAALVASAFAHLPGILSENPFSKWLKIENADYSTSSVMILLQIHLNLWRTTDPYAAEKCCCPLILQLAAPWFVHRRVFFFTRYVFFPVNREQITPNCEHRN